jgi:hypothetical protein
MQTLVNNRSQFQAKWCYLPLNWTGEAPKAEDQTWVQLLAEDLFADDQALLLCQESESQWVVWVPGQGETRLDISQFCINP